MDGGSSQALLQHDIKMQVKKTVSRKRLVRLTQDKRRGCAAPAQNSATDTDSIAPNRFSKSVEFSEEELPRSVGYDFELHLRQDWDGTPHGSTFSDGSHASRAAYADFIPAFGGAYSAQHLFRYFWTHIFASHFAYLPPLVAYAGRNWLSSTITKVLPLSDLTLALSAYHCRIRTPFFPPKEDSTWRYYYDSGLRGLRSNIWSFRKCQSLHAIRVTLQLLACNLQLILLDRERGSRTWLVHLRGMSGLMDMVVAYALSREFEELEILDRNGLEFIIQVFASLNRASAMINVGIPSFDRIE